ncbi:hypothetical protein BX616_001589, partial [Lobosporangium transversale]
MSVKDPRLSQILPVIRCSDCGVDVEFRLLGEHVCSAAPAMPALPALPISKPPSSGAYKPGYKPPPPVPVASSPGSPGSNSFNNNNNNSTNYNGSINGLPGSPGRPPAASPRPALPFLEKYAKKNKSATSAAASPPAPLNSYGNHNNSNNNTVAGSPLSISPTTPTAPSYDRQVHSNGMNNHYQREQSDYFPKTPMDDRFAHQQQPSRSRTPLDDGRYGASSPVPPRPKTPVTDSSSQFGTSPSSMRSSQPAVPQKSNARSPSVSSAQGLGIQGMDANGRMRSPAHGSGYSDSNRMDYPREEQEWDRGYDEHNYRGSSGSTASSTNADRVYQRERSNTVLSERSERSVRSARSERSERSGHGSRYEDERERDRDVRGMSTSSRTGRQDPSSAYKTPSPPISPEDAHSVDALSGPRQPYRPPTPPDVSAPVPSRGRAPPTRKPSGDQFDALMDDLMQEINVMPSGRDVSRPGSSHRSRSRPNLPEGGRSRDLGAGSPPPTPKINGGVDSRSQRSGRERSDRDRERSDRRDRERERERERGVMTGEERERARDRERSATSGRARSRSTNRRGAVPHCEGCKHDIQPQELAEAIKMPHGDYHPECFKCARCRRPLESSRHGYEYEGRLLCEKDYQRYLEKDAQRSDRPSRNRGAAVCAGCDAPIQGESPVYALGQAWHEHHLACYQCKKPIQQSVGHVEKNGRVYCPKDFGELFLPKCRGCGLPVEKEAVCAQDGKLQGKWHAACFGCQTCKKPFPDKSFYVYGDSPYCRRHYHKLNNSLCKGCDEPIEGPCAQTVE